MAQRAVAMPHASRNDRRESLISRLEEHAGEWITYMTLHKTTMVASYYFSLPNSRGGAVDPHARYYTTDGDEVTFDDVPLAKIAKDVESMIKRKVPADRRTEIYHKVLTGMPGYQEIPEWDMKSTASIYTEPLTPFSKPRDATVTNQDLLDALAPAAEITLADAKRIGIQITWWDAMSDGAFLCSMSFGSGISGGRLGRPHALEDVPVNYFRDKLMDWIAENLKGSEERKQAARKAICLDLADTEIEEYTRLIAEDRKKLNEEAERPSTPLTREELARGILENGMVVKTIDQAMKIVLMDEAVDEVDGTIDWETPKPMGIRRGRNEVEGSVVTPHWAPLASEGGLVPEIDVDRDCDQVRAMIKTFLSSWDWSAETFRMALGRSVTRDKFIAFLKKRGTDAAQLRSASYLLSWQFFNRRQKLGLPIVNVDFRDDLKTLDKKRRNKSLSEPQRAMVKAQEQELEAQTEKHNEELDALREAQIEQTGALEKAHVEQLKVLKEAQPRRSTRGSRAHGHGLRNESLSEQMRVLAEAQEKESEALSEDHRKELEALQKAQYQERETLEKAHEESMKASVEAQPGSSN
ncbi:hypothetical protein B0H67DRAFT_648731 [Lasiosphaeris hirsuta]|uniref:DUF7726 domain-containing protein n=1 Tax=Lasiosphaeris hirsuta TaxID=260670 RepID=A0AA40A3R3_9PEZI|nr:hypothetical protein B0H67DRAFT_648731 [Lasiosphaeris hirsuta]